MRQKYIWQSRNWPNLKWNSEELLEDLGKARKLQGRLLAQAHIIGLEAQATVLIDETTMTSAIEGEQLDRRSVRSSVTRRLGLPSAGLPKPQRAVDGLVELLLDATKNYAKPLTKDRLAGWHAALFPTGYSGLLKITTGDFRKGIEPMQVISGSRGRETVHFEAPPSHRLSKEIKLFLDWWKTPPTNLDGLLRAGIAHFWFITIHPFEDGNGRIARALTDLALAQDEQTGIRLYSLSTQILKQHKDYYEILEQCQKGRADNITLWLKWFLKILCKAIENSEDIIKQAIAVSEFWRQHRNAHLNPRQIKVIHRMLEAGPEGFEGGMTNRKYVSLSKVSRETAKRDLSELEEKGILKRNPGKGRSVSYRLNIK